MQERLKKLKKMATDQNGTAPATPKTPSKTKAGVAKSNATTPTSTPKKRKIATPKSAKAASKGKKDAKLGEVDATEEGQNGEGLEISDHDELGGHAVDPAYTGVTGSDEYFQQHHDADFYANENGVIHGEY